MTTQGDLFAAGVNVEAIRQRMRAEILEELVRTTMEKATKGCSCPVCHQRVKVYRRPLNATMVEALRALVRVWRLRGATGYVHVRDIPFRGADARVAGGELAKLVHWGLIEAEPAEPGDTSKRCSGKWRPTDRGLRFEADALAVPEAVYLYDGERIGDAERGVRITQVAGRRFDLAQVR